LEVERRAIHQHWCPRSTSQFVAETVRDGLPQVGLQGSATAGVKVFNPPKRSDQGVLDKVVRVREIARPRREPAARPPAKRADVPSDEALERIFVPLPDPFDQIKGRLEGILLVGHLRSRGVGTRPDSNPAAPEFWE
jgi:hypothetical protein